jgi:head-tail adaptor
VIGHLLRRQMDIYRRDETADGQGGTTTEWLLVGPANFKVDQPTAEELQVAEQSQSRHSHNIYAQPGTDIQRGDELRSGGQTFRLIAVVEPSQAIYRKALAELIQREP